MAKGFKCAKLSSRVSIRNGAESPAYPTITAKAAAIAIIDFTIVFMFRTFQIFRFCPLTDMYGMLYNIGQHKEKVCLLEK